MNEQVPVREAGVFFPGDIIERKYRIVKLLAEGGMGSVYHAVQEPLGRDVALKVLKPGNDSPEQRNERLKRFFREASVSSRLSHPNTVMIFDYGELPNDEGFFLVMEFLRGQVLRDLMPAGTYMDTSLALHITMQIAGSLAEAHAAGVVHRDLKPPNVMIVERGGDPFFVKVVDFGLVKDLEDNNNDELTAENTLLGSPTYMAPERFLSKNADSPSVDIYALGIVLYEMLTGRPPFQREGEATVHQLIMQQIQAEPPPLRTFRPDLMLPDGLEALIMRCLAKNPTERIASMDTLLRMLKAAASNLDGFSSSGSIQFPHPSLQQQPNAFQPLNDTGPGLEQHTQETSLDLLTSLQAQSRSNQPNAQSTDSPNQPNQPNQQTPTTQRQRKILLATIAILLILILGTAASIILQPKTQPPTDTAAALIPTSEPQPPTENPPTEILPTENPLENTPPTEIPHKETPPEEITETPPPEPTAHPPEKTAEKPTTTPKKTKKTVTTPKPPPRPADLDIKLDR